MLASLLQKLLGEIGGGELRGKLEGADLGAGGASARETKNSRSPLGTGFCKR